MQDDRKIEEIRRMSPDERWQMWLELSRLGWALWEANLSPAEIDRRWEIWRREHELSNENLRRGLAIADRP